MGNVLYICKKTASGVPGHDPEASLSNSSASGDEDESSENDLFDNLTDSVKMKRKQQEAPEPTTKEEPAPQTQHGFENPYLGYNLRSIDSDSEDEHLAIIPEEEVDAVVGSETEELDLPPDSGDEEVSAKQHTIPNVHSHGANRKKEGAMRG